MEVGSGPEPFRLEATRYRGVAETELRLYSETQAEALAKPNSQSSAVESFNLKRALCFFIKCLLKCTRILNE